jgi:MFS family permease
MTKAPLITPVLIAGCVILMISFAVRASFGVFQIPIATEFGWLRSDFSLAIAIQNLAWGIGQPLFGAMAEKFGDRRAIISGAILYAAGLVLSAYAVTPGQHQVLAILVGFGIAGTGFGVILAIVGRAASPENRSMALGIATAAGSAGQVFGAPTAEWLLQSYSWPTVFIIFAVVILATLAALPFLRSPQLATRQELEESLGTVLIRAFKDPSYTLIFLGFFSCGYQLAFITAHFPAFVTELCSPIDAGSMLSNLGVTTTSALGAVSIPGQALYQEVPAVRHLCRPHHRCRRVHPAADHTSQRAGLLGCDGRALAGHRAVDQWPGRPYLRHPLYGDLVRRGVPEPPDRRVPWRLAGGQDVRPEWRLHAGLVDWCRGWSILGYRPSADPRAQHDRATGLSPGMTRP